MKTVLIAAFALTAAAAPLSAANLNLNLDGLTVAQQAQVFGVVNSDENEATKNRLIKAILGNSNATDSTVTAAQVMFIEESDENSATRARQIDAVRN